MTSLLLTLVMLLSLVPAMGVTASAAEWMTVNTFEELHTAVNNKQKNIKLGRDIDTSSLHDGLAMNTSDLLDFKDQDFVLDLNGKTLHLEMKIANPYFIQVVSGSLTIKDSSTAKTGAITGLFGAVKGGWIDHLIFVGGNGSLTLEGGTFSVQGIPFSDVLNAVYCKNGNVTIKDGVKLSQPEFSDSGYAFDLDGNGYALCAELDKGSTGKVIIEGGEFDGCVKLTGSQAENGSVQINGGTFKKDVQVLYKAEKNNSNPAVTVNGGTFEGNVYLQGWDWKTSLYMPYRLNGGTFKGKLNLHADYKITAYDKPEGNPNIALGLDQCFGYSAVVAPDGTFAGPNAKTVVLKKTTEWDYEMLLNGSASNPVRIIPNAWGMKSVTLDGDPIDYAKDWNGAAVEITNDTAHTLKFEWYPLAQELIDAHYSYNAECEHYVSGSTAVQETENIAADKTTHTITIKKGADPKVYSFDLQLNLKKNDSDYNVGIMSNQHIVKLVVKPAEVPTPDPTIDGTVYYTSGIVFGSPISTAPSVTPAEATKSYQWQRSTDGGSTWTNIDGATNGKYTPVAADMGANVRIRVVVTAENYLGEIVGAPLTVNKAANNDYPKVIELEAVQDEAGAYTGFKINNYDPNCEYVYSETDTPKWNENQIGSDTVTGLTSDKTYYVFARFEETKTHTAGSIVSKNSIKLFGYVPLDRVLLEGYGSYGKIYIKNGESVTLEVSADPSNANSWKEITFKERSGTETGCITVTDDKIDESGENAAAFPKHSITINGVSKGSATLDASYSGPGDSKYGRWDVVVYDETNVEDALRLENVYTYEDITLSEKDEAKLPTDLPTLLPANSGYHLEWRIVEVGTYGASYKTSDDNIELVDGKIIKPKAAHATSEKTRLELVAVKEGQPIKHFSQTSRFNVTVTEAPVIALTGLTVAPKQVNLANVDDTFQLSAVKQPANAPGSLTWSSDKPEIATVSSTGMVTAVAKGKATITVSCGEEMKATCTVLVDHKHSYEDQPYLYLDPGNHYQECTAGDDYNIQAHTFTNWADNENGTHSRHCNVCKMTNGSTYTETAEHTWVWVVDQEAALNQPGLQHEECTGCHAKRNENTEIPALRDYAVTVTGGTATVAAGTPITRAMAGVEVTVTAQAPAGKHFVKWVVKAGGVTLANETSATTTFIMPATDVEIEANFEKNASTGTGTGATTYPITVKSAKNGDVTASHKTASKGTTVTLTVDPDKGYLLDTLTVLDGKDKEIKLTEKNGKYTFVMPDSKVTVAATFKPLTTTGKHPFTDVPAGAYYEDAVVWAVGKNITTGMSAAAFDPNGSCTRAQIVTFLWRAAGSPEPKTMKGFDDVASNAYYAKAVAWAVENGITTGTSASKFSPNDPCTRTQAVTFLFRYAAANGMEAVTMQELLSGYADAASVPSYAVSAMNWALAAGILQGDGVKLMPNATCTRAQIVTFLYRAMK